MTIPSSPRSSTPPFAPRPILRWLLLAIFACALAGALLPKWGIPIWQYLTLSLPALSRGYVWTLISYPFSYPSYHLMDLIFRVGVDLLLLLFFGSILLDRMSAKRFLTLFFGATLASGLVAAASMLAFHGQFLSGPSPALLALYTAWAILHTTQDSPPILKQFPWIIALFIGLSLLLDLMAGVWPTFFADLTGILFGYAFCIIQEKATSSIRWLHPLEHALHAACERFHAPPPIKDPHKVIDFKTGQPVLDDDQFMDAMLARISLYGDSVLTPEEKNRMRKISEKKSLKK